MAKVNLLTEELEKNIESLTPEELAGLSRRLGLSIRRQEEILRMKHKQRYACLVEAEEEYIWDNKDGCFPADESDHWLERKAAENMIRYGMIFLDDTGRMVKAKLAGGFGNFKAQKKKRFALNAKYDAYAKEAHPSAMSLEEWMNY